MTISIPGAKMGNMVRNTRAHNDARVRIWTGNIFTAVHEKCCILSPDTYASLRFLLFSTPATPRRPWPSTRHVLLPLPAYDVCPARQRALREGERRSLQWDRRYGSIGTHRTCSCRAERLPPCRVLNTTV